MLTRLAELAKKGKEIWAFLALVAGLGATYGKLSSKLDALDARVGVVDRKLDREVDKLDDRLARAGRSIERRMDASDRLTVGLRDAVTRLVVIEEVRQQNGGRRVAIRLPAPQPPTAHTPTSAPTPGPDPALLKQLRLSVDRVLKQRPPTDLPAF